MDKQQKIKEVDYLEQARKFKHTEIPHTRSGIVVIEISDYQVQCDLYERAVEQIIDYMFERIK